MAGFYAATQPQNAAAPWPNIAPPHTLETHGRVPRGYLGLGLQPVAVEGGASGVIVMGVDPEGPGAAANIHQGDVIVSWDGKPIGKLQPLLRSLGPDSVGKLLVIELRRGGQSHQTRLQIGERPGLD